MISAQQISGKNSESNKPVMFSCFSKNLSYGIDVKLQVPPLIYKINAYNMSGVRSQAIILTEEFARNLLREPGPRDNFCYHISLCKTWAVNRKLTSKKLTHTAHQTVTTSNKPEIIHSLNVFNQKLQTQNPIIVTKYLATRKGLFAKILFFA